MPRYSITLLRPLSLLTSGHRNLVFTSVQDLQYVAICVEAPTPEAAGKLALDELVAADIRDGICRPRAAYTVLGHSLGYTPWLNGDRP